MTPPASLLPIQATSPFLSPSPPPTCSFLIPVAQNPCSYPRRRRKTQEPSSAGAEFSLSKLLSLPVRADRHRSHFSRTSYRRTSSSSLPHRDRSPTLYHAAGKTSQKPDRISLSPIPVLFDGDSPAEPSHHRRSRFSSRHRPAGFQISSVALSTGMEKKK